MSFSCMTGLEIDKIRCVALFEELGKAEIDFIYKEPSMLSKKKEISPRKLEN